MGNVRFFKCFVGLLCSAHRPRRGHAFVCMVSVPNSTVAPRLWMPSVRLDHFPNAVALRGSQSLKKTTSIAHPTDAPVICSRTHMKFTACHMLSMAFTSVFLCQCLSVSVCVYPSLSVSHCVFLFLSVSRRQCLSASTCLSVRSFVRPLL